MSPQVEMVTETLLMLSMHECISKLPLHVLYLSLYTDIAI
jgi:hypothetical protein